MHPASGRLRAALLCGGLLVHGLSCTMAASHLIFFGTYTNKGTSKGIYAARLDAETGAISTPQLVAAAADPAWIALTPDKKFLYAIAPTAAQAIGFSVDAAHGTLTPLPAAPAAAAQPPSHLAVDATGRVLLGANYREGYVAAMSIAADGSLGAPNIVRHAGKGTHPTRQEKPHAHSVTLSPDNRHVIVADLGVDKIFSYALVAPKPGEGGPDPAPARLTPAHAPFVAATPGSGPRHFKFGLSGKHAYAINELTNTIATYDYDAVTGALTPRQTVSTLPAGYTAPTSTAEVRVHPNGKFLYGSNRGHDSIAVFAVDTATGLLSASPVEIVPTGGRNPRNFALSPDGKWLVCGHQDTELVTVFRVDGATGRLTRTPHSAPVPSAVSVLFYD